MSSEQADVPKAEEGAPAQALPSRPAKQPKQPKEKGAKGGAKSSGLEVGCCPSKNPTPCPSRGNSRFFFVLGTMGLVSIGVNFCHPAT